VGTGADSERGEGGRRVDRETGAHVSCVMSALLLRKVAELGGAATVAQVLARSGTGRGRDYLTDSGNWISYDEANALWDAAGEVTHHRALARRVGAEAGAELAGSQFASLLRSPGSPEEVYRQLINTTARYSTIATIEIVELGRGHAEIAVRAVPGYPRSVHLCEWVVGLLSQPPVLFGAAPARVVHDKCAAVGAPECRYAVSWQADPTAAAPGSTDEVDRLQRELDSMRERLRGMFDTASDLVGAGSLDDVLARIADRASTEIRAPRHLLAVRMTAGQEVRCHAKGFSDAEIEYHRDRLMADGSPPAPDSWLIVPVRSQRRDYGYLLAAYPEQTRVLPQERRQLEVYARYAAVALDSAAARLEAERRSRESGRLLQFSRAISIAGTSRDIARRLAQSIPVLVDCDEVGVYLWDGTEFTSYARERLDPDAGPRELLLPQQWRPRPGGSLERFVSDPGMEPVFMDLERGGAPRDTETLRLLGACAGIVAPLGSRGELLGAAAVIASDRPERLSWSPELSARITGIAAQATAALENGRLLDVVTHQAFYDQLTGLANRLQFGADLRDAVTRAQRDGAHVGLFYMDLDRFKSVNDQLGHAAGDELLAAVARRLLESTRDVDTVGRLGGDEFAVVVAASSTAELDRVGDRLAAAFERPFAVHRRRVWLSSSVGRAVFPADAAGPDELIRLADAAMYARKTAGVHAPPSS
jgi:diguanylate cyclase (GGDEF)-like protein